MKRLISREGSLLKKTWAFCSENSTEEEIEGSRYSGISVEGKKGKED